MPLRDIRIYSKLRYEEDHTMGQRLILLEKHRLFVVEQQKKWHEYLANLDGKIDFYKKNQLQEDRKE